MRTWLVVVIAVTAACGKSGGGSSGGGSTGSTGGATAGGAGSGAAVAARRPWPPGAPPPLTCAVDADCTILVSGPGGDDPCCDVTLTAAPMAVAWVKFITDWRATNCAGAACPPMPLPGARLADCGYQPRCTAGTCDNACPE